MENARAVTCAVVTPDIDLQLERFGCVDRIVNSAVWGYTTVQTYCLRRECTRERVTLIRAAGYGQATADDLRLRVGALEGTDLAHVSGCVRIGQELATLDDFIAFAGLVLSVSERRALSRPIYRPPGEVLHLFNSIMQAYNTDRPRPTVRVFLRGTGNSRPNFRKRILERLQAPPKKVEDTDGTHCVVCASPWKDTERRSAKRRKKETESTVVRVVYGCGHQNVCAACTNQLFVNQQAKSEPFPPCPMCRAPIRQATPLHCLMCTKPATVQFLPCAHVSLCRSCAVAAVGTFPENECPTCPLCAADIKDVLQGVRVQTAE